MNDHEQNIEIMKDLRNRLDAVIKKEAPEVKIPDPAKHFKLSMYKSAIRIAGGAALTGVGLASSGWLVVAGICIVIAEIVGIAEEMV